MFDPHAPEFNCLECGVQLLPSEGIMYCHSCHGDLWANMVEQAYIEDDERTKRLWFAYFRANDEGTFWAMSKDQSAPLCDF